MTDKKAAVLLADGYEEGESLFLADILRRTGVACDTVPIEGELVRGCHDMYVKADRIISPDMYDEYDMVIIPGGMPGAANLRDCRLVTDWVRKFDEEGIEELTRLCGSQLQELIRRVRALRRIEDAYTSFSGIPEGVEGSVRFMIETEEIAAGQRPSGTVKTEHSSQRNTPG
jgi:hypothetical protein